jgi:hypothetical protein
LPDTPENFKIFEQALKIGFGIGRLNGDIKMITKEDTEEAKLRKLKIKMIRQKTREIREISKELEILEKSMPKEIGKGKNKPVYNPTYSEWKGVPDVEGTFPF